MRLFWIVTHAPEEGASSPTIPPMIVMYVEVKCLSVIFPKFAQFLMTAVAEEEPDKARPVIPLIVNKELELPEKVVFAMLTTLSMTKPFSFPFASACPTTPPTQAATTTALLKTEHKGPNTTF